MTPTQNTSGSVPREDTDSIQWHTIFNAISNPAIILDRGYRVIAANNASLRLTGMPPDDIIGKHCYEVFHHRTDGTADGCPMENMLQNGVMEPVEMEIEALGGTFYVSCTPILATDGSLDKVIHIASDVTFRKEIELKLGAESSLNRSIINNAPEGLCVCHAVPEFPYVQFTVWNERMKSITGYTRAELNTGGYYQTLYPDQELQSRASERIERMRGGDHLTGENWKITNKQGEERIVAIWTSLLILDDGSEHIMAFFIDVTEHKKLEKLHEQSRQDWEDTFQSINDAITILDCDYNIVRANRAAEELLNAPASCLNAQKCYAAYHGLGHPLSECPSCLAMASGQPTFDEYFEAHLGKHLELKAFPRIGCDGEVTGIIHVVRDISERKKAEIELQEQKNFTTSLIRNSASAMFVLDSLHHVQVWNRACENLTGLSHSEMMGSDDHWKAFYASRQPTLADVILDGDFSRLSSQYSSVSRSLFIPDGYKAEGWFKQINGKDRYLMIEASPLYDSKGNMTHAFESINDLTESKSLEEQLLHSQKMESIGLLSGGIAHEFNNILAVILGYGQVMRKELDPESTSMNDLDQILNSAERAAELTKGLLTFSCKNHITLKNMDLALVVHNTLKSFSRVMGDDISITEKRNDDPVIIFADQSLVTQIILNLMGNARDSMPNGGTIEVSTTRVVVSEPLAFQFNTVPSGTYAHISLSDSGHGIAESIMERIFEPFFTTKDIGKGTGLGLSVVYGIVSQHNGYINVTSTPGQGSCFSIYFPLIELKKPSNLIHDPPSAKRGAGETILIADDEPLLLKLFSEALSAHGYNVVTASNGAEAIEKFVANKDDISLLILDVQMRHKSGLEVSKEIKTIRPEVKVLFVSGFNIEQFHGDMSLDEDAELLMKPFLPTVLVAKVRKMLDLR